MKPLSMENYRDWYLHKMRTASKFTEAKNYAIAAKYDVGQLIKDRYMK